MRRRKIKRSGILYFFLMNWKKGAILVMLGAAFYALTQVDVSKESVELSTTRGNNVSVPLNDYESALQSKSAKKLMAVIKRLNRTKDKQDSLPDQLAHEFKRLTASKRLLEASEDVFFESNAINTGIDSATRIYSLNFKNDLKLPNAKNLVLEVTEPFVQHSSLPIRRNAQLNLASLNLLELRVGQEGAPSKETVMAATKSFSKFANDIVALDHLKNSILKILKARPEYGTELIEQVFGELKKHEDLEVVNTVYELNDHLLLREANFDRVVAERWAAGDRGQQALVATICRLVSHPDCGNGILNRASATIQWFEQIHGFENAKQICDTLMDQSKQRADWPMAYQAKKIGERGLVRLSCFRKKLDLGKLPKDGRVPRRWEGLEIKVIAFLSDDGGSQHILRRLERLDDQLAKDGVRIIKVNLDEQPKSEIRKVSFEPATHQESYSTAAGGRILKQYPVARTPYLLIVNHQDRVVRMNVQIADLETCLQVCFRERNQD